MKSALAALAIVLASPSLAETHLEIGLLTCTLQDVKNDIVYSSEKFACEFKPKSGEPQTYSGQMKSIGIDLKVTKDMTLVWAVLAPTRDAASTDTLAGKYVGAGAAVSVGAGGGADVLIGGGHKSFTLQPISVSGMVGAGASVGIESFELR